MGRFGGQLARAGKIFGCPTILRAVEHAVDF